MECDALSVFGSSGNFPGALSPLHGTAILLMSSGRKDEENDAGSVSSDDPSSTGSHSPELLWTGGKRSFVSPLKESRKPVSVRFDESRLAPGHDRLGKGQEAMSQVVGRFLVDSARTAFLIASFSL